MSYQGLHFCLCLAELCVRSEEDRRCDSIYKNILSWNPGLVTMMGGVRSYSSFMCGTTII